IFCGTLTPDIYTLSLHDALPILSEQFADAWIKSGASDQGLSYPADKPVTRIDYILFRQGDRIRTKKAWIVSTLVSDHVPVVADRSEEHTSELQSPYDLVCRLLLE